MPPDLSADLSAMQGLIADLGRAQASARAVHGGHDAARRELDAAVGEASLQKAIGHFFGKWQYGCGLLASDVETLRSWLDVVTTELARADADLAVVAGGGQG